MNKQQLHEQLEQLRAALHQVDSLISPGAAGLSKDTPNRMRFCGLSQPFIKVMS